MSPDSVSERLRLERLGVLHETCLRLAKRQERENYTQLVACRCDDPALLRIIRWTVWEPGKEPPHYSEDERDRRARLNMAVWSSAGRFAGVPLHDRFQDRLRTLGPKKAQLLPDMQLVIDGEPWFGVVLGDKRSFERGAADAAELTTPRQTDPPDFFPNWQHTYAQRDWLETLVRVVGMKRNRFGLLHKDPPAGLSSTGEIIVDATCLPYDLFTASAKAIELLTEAERTADSKTDTPPASTAAVTVNDDRGQKIIASDRTIPMAYRRAAKLMGKGDSQDAAEWLSKSVKNGKIVCEHVTRQMHVFSRRDFPENVWPRILPPESQPKST